MGRKKRWFCRRALHYWLCCCGRGGRSPPPFSQVSCSTRNVSSGAFPSPPPAKPSDVWGESSQLHASFLSFIGKSDLSIVRIIFIYLFVCLFSLGTVNFTDGAWQGRAPYTAPVFRGCRMENWRSEDSHCVGGSTWGKYSPAAEGLSSLSLGLVHIVIVNMGTKES